MSAWHKGPLVAFDVETSGTSTDTDRIVSACVALIQPGQPVEPMTWLLDPGIEIPEAASAIHGITTERCRNEGQPAHEGVGEIADQLASFWALGLPVVGFNIVFDLTILDRELRRHGRPPLEPGHVIDAYVLDKHVSYRRGSRKLADQCRHYGVRIDGAHDAAADALAAARVAWRIAQTYPTVRDKSLAELHAAQVQWAAEQAASFRDYLIRQGRTEDLPHGEWPMRAYTPHIERSVA
jgi:DNA polymerase-3 subunit epsilon